MSHRLRCMLIAASTVLLGACSPQKIQQTVNASLELHSTTVADGKLPARSGCDGEGTSPELSWGNPPAGTRSFALVIDDQDSTVGHLHRHYFVHGLAFDLSPDRRELAEGALQKPLNPGEQAGRNDVGSQGYAGPCPDKGSTHHYAITLYALDTLPGLPASTDGRHLLGAIDGHILARGQIVGTYTR